MNPLTLHGKDFFNQGFPFSIAKYFHVEDFQIYTHLHDFIEIAYVYNGSGIHQINNKKYDVRKGDIYIIPPSVPHVFYPYDLSQANQLILFNCLFTTEFLQDLQINAPILQEFVILLNQLNESHLSHPTLIAKDTSSFAIGHLYEKMHKEYELKQPGYRELLKVHLLECLLLIYRQTEEARLPLQQISQGQCIYQAIDYLHQNYLNDISLDDICQHALLSKSYFCNQFKRSMGISVFQYLQKLRIEKSCELLLTSNYTVTAIGAMVGYSDYAYFNKVFKKIIGLSPNEYRKSHFNL